MCQASVARTVRRLNGSAVLPWKSHCSCGDDQSISETVREGTRIRQMTDGPRYEAVAFD